MQITLELDELAAYGGRLLGESARLCSLDVSELEGGHAGAEVYRLDLAFRLAGGASHTVSLVLKNTGASEVGVMRALREVPGADALPLTIACGEGGHDRGKAPVHWFVAPLYEGEHLTFEDEVPRLAIESLARVHAHYVSRVGQLGWLRRLDGDAVRQALDEALQSLEAAQRRQPHALLAQAHADLASAGQDPAILAALEALPVTLTHGDVHPWNIVRLPGERAVLIDWGNALVAPPMIDLANLVEIDSENWETYLAAWERARGAAMDSYHARLGYYWATVMINLHYLPYGAGQWPQDGNAPAAVLGMVERLQDAVRALSELLSAGETLT
jgi:aminoglycoside phosphotransferase (APT) family kinase protein